MTPERSSSTGQEQRRIDFAAAEWTVRCDRGLTAREQDELHQWLAQDLRHVVAFKRQQDTWKEFDSLLQSQPEPTVTPACPTVPEHRVRRVWQWSALAAAAVVMLAVGWWQLAAPRPVDSPPETRAVSLAASYERRVLDDGSVVQLNRGAAIAARYTDAARHVALTQGEAYFTVAKNPARPFIVQAQGVEVRAVGTAFNVRLANEGVEVIVTEGRVKVNAPNQRDDEAVLVSAGERALVPTSGSTHAPVEKISSDEIERALAWQPQLLDFASTPLSEVVAAFNRRNATQLVIDDPALASLPIVATFRSDNVEGFVRLLEATAGVKARREASRITLSRAP